MAERRMFAKTIVDSDAFIEMPQSTQLLYFHFGMRADDDGFINKPQSIMRSIGCKDDDLKILCAKGFVIPFDSGIIVIKHWRIHNYIQRDRYKGTVYTEEKQMIVEKENRAYTIAENVSKLDTMDTQSRLGKVRIGKDRDRDGIHALGTLENVLLSDTELFKLDETYGEHIRSDYVERLSLWKPNAQRKVKNDYATLLTWIRKDKIPKQAPRELPCKLCGGRIIDGQCRNAECPQYGV